MTIQLGLLQETSWYPYLTSLLEDLEERNDPDFNHLVVSCQGTKAWLHSSRLPHSSHLELSLEPELHCDGLGVNRDMVIRPDR